MQTTTVEEYRKILKKESNTRRNQRVAEDGYSFDSKAEARRYLELKQLAQSGTISALAIHPTYELQAAFTDATGRRHRAIRYEGDFGYTEAGERVIEDVKGHRTAVFLIKEKLFRFRFPHINFRIIDIY